MKAIFFYQSAKRSTGNQDPENAIKMLRKCYKSTIKPYETLQKHYENTIKTLSKRYKARTVVAHFSKTTGNERILKML